MSKIFKRGAFVPSSELKDAVKHLFRKGGSADVRAVKRKSLAVTSGKGGVGKTITAVNLSIYCAKNGLSTALIDLDPLSNVAFLLDLAESEAALAEEQLDLTKTAIADFSTPVLKNLDLIFPNPKLKAVERSALLKKLYQDLIAELNSSYDLLVFDLPAGSDFDNNLVFLPFMGMVLLVTNPEPTAHAAAGAYIKQSFDLFQELTIHIWHNRFTTDSREGFDPLDVVGNYNKNVAGELRIDDKLRSHLPALAAIPEDPALNLLRGSPTADLNILRFLLDTLKFIYEERVAALAAANISNRSFELIKFFIARHKRIGDVESYLEEVGEYLRQILYRQIEASSTMDVFTPEQRRGLRSFILTVAADELCDRIVRTIDLLEEKLQNLEDKRSPFNAATAVVPDKALDRETSALLVEINKLGGRELLIQNQGGLLLFYFALYKLFQSETVTGLIRSLVPTKTDRKGAAARDRNRQIRNLIEGDAEYKKRYLKLLKTLHPIVSKQIANIVKVFGLSGLLFRHNDGQIVRSAYVKLLTNFLHDTLYSGLSVVIGFPFRSAAGAFSSGAEKTLAFLGTLKEQA